MRELKTLISDYRVEIARVFLVALLFFQFAGFVSVYSIHIDPRSLLSARDADGAHVVGTANRSRWYKDNGDSAYGALFYRLAHSFTALSGRQFANSSSEVENSERATHLVVMTISLLSVFAISLLLSGLVTETWTARLFVTLAMNAIFLSNSTWATFVFRAHPDMLFGLFALLAFLATERMLSQPGVRRWFILAATLWGLCGMVKLSFVTFLPALLFLFIPPFTKGRLKLAVQFYLWMLPGYLLVGFPQSFNFPRSIEFLLDQSEYAIPPTLESLNTWLNTFALQSWLPVLIVGLVALGSRRASGVGLMRLLPLIVIPLLVIFRQNSEYRADYYLIPQVALLTAWIGLLLRGRVRKVARLIPLIAIVPIIYLGLVPSTMEAALKPTLRCREDATLIYENIHQTMDQGRVFLLDPYVPFDKTRAGEKGNSGWSNTWDEVYAKNATALALSIGYASRFLREGGPPHGVQVDSPNWPLVRDFYLSFHEKEEAVDPKGGVWKRTMKVKCGQEIWLKQVPESGATLLPDPQYPH